MGELSGSSLLVASHALLRSRWTHVGSSFDDLIVTTATVSVIRLLIVQCDQRSAFLLFDLRELRQELRFCIRPRMTIATNHHLGRLGIFFKEIGCQS